MRLFLARMGIILAIGVLRHVCLAYGLDITPSLAMVAFMFAMVPIG